MDFSNLVGDTAALGLTVRPVAESDLKAILAIERRPGFEAFVGRSDEAEHRAMLAAPGFAYRLGLGEDGAAAAFAILAGLGDPHGNVCVKRIAADRPGRGTGTALLARVLDEAFGPLGAWRVHLDCFAGNARAQKAYQKLGFSRDGVLREAYLGPDGRRRDLVMMAITRPEWRARRRRG